MQRPVSFWSHQQVYVAPANPAGRQLAATLRLSGAVVPALVDNLKQADDVIQQAAAAQPYTALLIAFSDFQLQIAQGLVQRGFPAQKIWLACDKSAAVFQPYRQQKLRQTIGHWALQLRQRLLRLLPHRYVIYYAERYVDSNVLVAFDYHRRQTTVDKVFLVVRKAERQFHPSQLSDSWLTLWRLCCAKAIVIDHESTDPLFNQLRQHKAVVQLWHGLPFKHLAGNLHFPHILDHSFVSSSCWFNQQVFPGMFKAQQYQALGYPRNDALLQKAVERCWFNALPQSLLQQIRNGGRLIIYMPTFRDNGANQYPLDMPQLQLFLQQQNAILVMKTHPFLAPFDDLRQEPGANRIYHYPGRANIYPWLADADVLITDYSSVAFDFLLCDKPIVHYVYDWQNYVQMRGQFVLAEEDFIAGSKAQDFAELLAALAESLASDLHQSHRQQLLQKFAMVQQPACPQLINYLEQLSD